MSRIKKMKLVPFDHKNDDKDMNTLIRTSVNEENQQMSSKLILLVIL